MDDCNYTKRKRGESRTHWSVCWPQNRGKFVFFFADIPQIFDGKLAELISMTFFFESWTYLGKNKYRNDQFLHIISQFVLISCSCNGRTGARMDGRALFMSIVKNVHTYLINFLSSIYVDLSKTWLVIYKISISITNMCFYLW